MMMTLAAVAAANAAVQDVNSWLASAYRCDTVGPEVWTATAKGVRPDGTEESYKAAERPDRVFGTPKPGLNGLLHVMHGVPKLVDAMCLEIEAGGKPVEFVPVRNRWTPAFCTTYYRSLPGGVLSMEIPNVGCIVLKETKAVLQDNTFLAEATLKNASATSIVCRVAVKTRGGLPEPGAEPAQWRFATVSMSVLSNRVTCAAAATSFGGAVKTLELAAHGEATFRYALAFAPESPSAAASRAQRALGAKDAFEANAKAFNEWFDRNVPRLETGDPDLLKMYFYRWFVVKRGTHENRRVVADHEYPRTAVYESPAGSWYGCVIGLPVPMQIQEIAWERSPDVLRSHVLNWCEKVRGYRGYIQFTGEAIARSFENHPSEEFAKKVLPAVVEFAREVAGKDPSRLPVQTGSWGTGAEYQSNFYQFTEPKWDYRNDSEFAGRKKKNSDSGKKFHIAKLVRLDTAVYAIGNLLGAARIAEIAGDPALAADLRKFAASQTEIIRTRHWDDSLGLFLAADPKTYRLADEAACYDSFAPYLWGLICDDKYLRAFDKLTDRAWFWDDFPISTCAKTCPMYCAENAIISPPSSPAKPHYYGCCWNGPMWHYANALAAEAFGQGARRRPELRAKWVEFFHAWNESHWLYGDRTAPRAAEHFRPEDGAREGGAWDYLHSSWIDPFMRYYCGIQLAENGRTIRFEPFAAKDFRLANVPLAGREFTFVLRMEGDERHLAVYDAAGKRLASGVGGLDVPVRR